MGIVRGVRLTANSMFHLSSSQGDEDNALAHMCENFVV
jgi:hypothetical protein